MNRKIVMLLAIPLAIGAGAAQSAEKAEKKEKSPAATSAAATPPLVSQDRSAETIVNKHCIECHSEGKNHAPRLDDRDDWLRRASRGLDAMVLAATRGHDGMPARGGRPDLTDSEFRNAIFYMFTKSVTPPAKK